LTKLLDFVIFTMISPIFTFVCEKIRKYKCRILNKRIYKKSCSYSLKRKNQIMAEAEKGFENAERGAL